VKKHGGAPAGHKDHDFRNATAIISQNVADRAVNLVSTTLLTVMLAFDKKMEGARIDSRTFALHATHVLVSRECDLFEDFARDGPLAICRPAHGAIRLASQINQSEYLCSEIGHTISCVQQRLWTLRCWHRYLVGPCC
jgi:hypothetical protein